MNNAEYIAQCAQSQWIFEEIVLNDVFGCGFYPIWVARECQVIEKSGSE
jgi:hypothetical protein